MRPRLHINRRRTSAALAVTAAAALLIPLTGCDAVQKAMDCGQVAVDITAGAEQFSSAMGNAGEDPQAAIDALNQLDKDLDKLGGKTDDADVSKAVDNLADQVRETRDALNDGRVPSPAPVTDAAAELAKVCTPG